MRKITLIKYKSIFNDDEYFAAEDPVVKTIDGIKFIEVTSSVKKIKPLFIRADSLKKDERVEIEL